MSSTVYLEYEKKDRLLILILLAFEFVVSLGTNLVTPKILLARQLMK